MILINNNEKYIFLYRADLFPQDIPKREQYLSLLIEG